MRFFKYVFTILFVPVLVGCFCVPNRLQAATNEEAYGQLIKLTKVFRGSAPYKCLAIVGVNYKGDKGIFIQDTSKLIYRNGVTYYSSPSVLRVEGSEGEIMVSHELKRVSFHLSDSLREIAHKILNVEIDPELESMIEENTDATDMANFKSFLVNNCTMRWDKKEGFEEIQFKPKQLNQAVLLSVTIRFSEEKISYYEYTYRDVYATDYKGNSRFRVIKTHYQDFQYKDVPPPPMQLSDLIQWNGWTVKLKKYLNYQLTVL